MNGGAVRDLSVKVDEEDLLPVDASSMAKKIKFTRSISMNADLPNGKTETNSVTT
jgi:hypothetical protein